MLSAMTPQEWVDWQMAFCKRPFGEYVLQGMLATTNFLLWLSMKGEDSPDLTLEDFMPTPIDWRKSDDETEEVNHVVEHQIQQFLSTMGSKLINLDNKGAGEVSIKDKGIEAKS